MRRTHSQVLLIFSALTLTSNAAHAQRRSTAMLAFVGATRSNMNGSDILSGTSARTGITVGVAVERSLGKNAALDVGAIFRPRGYNYKNGTITADLSMSYIDVPILLALSPNNAAPTAFSLLAGIGGNLKVACSINSSVGTGSGTSDCPTSGANAVHGFDASAVVGARVVHRGAPIGIGGQFEFIQSLSNAFDGTEGKHRVLALTLVLSR